MIRRNPAFYEELMVQEEIIRDSIRALRYQQRLNNSVQQQAQSQSPDNATRRQPTVMYVDDELLEEEIVVPKYKMREDETQSIGIKLSNILSEPKSRFDLRIIDGDTIDIPRELETVKMTGELLYPISSRYDRNKSFKKYIADAGGFSEDADRKRAYVVYANGSADRTRNFLFFKNYPKSATGSRNCGASQARATANQSAGVGSHWHGNSHNCVGARHRSHSIR